MDISTLHAFIAVARYQSFSKASESLFITQPAISKRVAALEIELGTQLFNRIARQISLTDAGKQLLPKAQEVVNQAEDMQRYASNLKHDISGDLSVAIAHHVGLHRMPPILKQFNQRHPKVKLDIRFEDSDKAFMGVQQGDIEFAVITLPSVLPDRLIKQVIWQDDLNFVVGVDHPLVNSGLKRHKAEDLIKQSAPTSPERLKQVSLKMLSEYPCVLTSQDTETHQIIHRKFQQQGLELDVQMQTNNLETLKMLTAAGLGWSVLPKTMNDDSIIVLNTQESLSRELGLVIHNKRTLSKAAHVLKTLIEKG